VTTLPLFQVDAFTDRAFRGNPAAVVLLDEPADAAWMQAVAAEMNLAETAFLVPAGAAAFDLRWFTPTVEVDLCGHATLASAHVLWSEGRVDEEAITFATRSGELVARRCDGGIELDLPALHAARHDPPAGLFEALGIAEGTFAATDDGWYLVELADERAVRAVVPDMRALASFAISVVTAPADAGADTASRVFGPSVGIDEDPVTGSAHCLLATWWADRLGPAFRARQVSARGGELDVRLDGDRVRLVGRAVTVLRGELVA
jgi:PhzF family phenazine biosynthesis protein